MKPDQKETNLVLRKTTLRVMNEEEVMQVASGALAKTATCASECICYSDRCNPTW